MSAKRGGAKDVRRTDAEVPRDASFKSNRLAKKADWKYRAKTRCVNMRS